MKKIESLLTEFNNSFELEANITDNENEKVVSGLKIKELKNDGSGYINEMIEMFSQIISANGENELVFDDKKGLVIAKKIVTVNYVL